MSHISEVLVGYINTKYTPELRGTIFRFFNLMAKFGDLYVEDKFTNLIVRFDELDPEAISTQFTFLIKKDLVNLIALHGITLETDLEYNLETYVSIAEVLYLITNLDDYGFIYRRVNTDQRPKDTLIDILVNYGSVSRIDLMCLITNVKESLITLLQQLCKSYNDSPDESTVETEHSEFLDIFLKYIGEEQSTARDLLDKGYAPNLSLSELLSVYNGDLIDEITQSLGKDLAQGALNVLSLMIFVNDNYKNPLEVFENNYELVSKDLRLKMKLSNVMGAMFGGFRLYVDALKQQEVLAK